jgi:hypothetical protein
MTDERKPIVLLQPFEGYDISIGSKVWPGFRVVSDWNGMLELRDAKGRTLIIDASSPKNDFERVFTPAVQAIFGADPSREAVMVKGSPDLLAELRS